MRETKERMIALYLEGEGKQILCRVLDVLDLGLLLLGRVVRVVLLSLLSDGLCKLGASSEVVALRRARKTRRRINC